MNNKMHVILLALLSVLLWANALSAQSTAIGVWQTESSNQGYLHVSIEPCEDLLCGTIVSAYDLEDNRADNYEFLGEKVVWGMQQSGVSKWKKGKIWDPSEDKTYKSKMSLDGDTLSVSGCVLFFCRSQKWSRVK